MTWRYQPVWTEQNGERYFSLCEVYFDDDSKLRAWTENNLVAAGGESQDELRRDLVNMLVDSYRWHPVEFLKLEIGMTFERAVSPEQFESLAQLVEAMAHNMGSASSVCEGKDDD